MLGAGPIGGGGQDKIWEGAISPSFLPHAGYGPGRLTSYLQYHQPFIFQSHCTYSVAPCILGSTSHFVLSCSTRTRHVDTRASYAITLFSKIRTSRPLLCCRSPLVLVRVVFNCAVAARHGTRSSRRALSRFLRVCAHSIASHVFGACGLSPLILIFKRDELSSP